MIFLLMDSSSKKRVEQEATELSEKILKIAEMVSERKLRTAIGVVKGSVFRSGTYMQARAQVKNQCKHLAYRKLCYLTLLYGRFSLGLYVLLPRYFRRVLCLLKKN